MRILHGSDFHLGLASLGRSARAFYDTFDLFATVAIREKVDAAVIAGDLFHRRQPGAAELLAAVQTVRRLRETGIDVVIVPGNHDGMGTIADPTTHTMAWLAALRVEGVAIATHPVVHLNANATWAMLPYAHKRSIEVGTIPERTAEASRILAETIGRLAERRYGDLPMIFVGHLTTTSARLGAEAAMRMGWDATVDPAVFDPFDYAALGHIHWRQQISAKAAYSGSPDVHAFGEEPQEKGWWLVDVQAGKDPDLRFIPSGTMQVIDWTLASFLTVTGSLAGAAVRLILSEPLEPAELRRAVQSLRTMGASVIQVVPPPVAAVYRGREGVIDVAGMDRRDQMTAWLEAHGHPVQPALELAESLFRE